MKYIIGLIILILLIFYFKIDIIYMNREDLRVRKAEVDYYAFVALDIMRIAYIPISKMIAERGTVKQTIDLREKHYDKYKKI